jgi:hypothetical protein
VRVFAVACTGKENTALRWISQRMYISSPDSVFGPQRKSASKTTGSEAAIDVE